MRREQEWRGEVNEEREDVLERGKRWKMERKLGEERTRVERRGK